MFMHKDIQQYRDRLISTDYVKIIFKPIINTGKNDSEVDKNHCVSSVN